MRRYRYHGVTIESPLAFDLPEECEPGSGLRVSIRHAPGLQEPRREPAWTSPITGYRLHFEGLERCWRANDSACFLLTPEEILVDPVPLDVGRTEYLLTSVLALWLQLTGRPVLHAASVALDPGAVALLARSGGGKSTLASALVTRGAEFLCDDHLPVHFEGDVCRVWSGQPAVKLWPDSARRITADIEALPRIEPSSEKRWVAMGATAEAPATVACAPLKVLYVLDRVATGDRGVSIERLPAAEGLMTLLVYEHMAGVSEMIGAGPGRLQSLTRLVREIPVRRIRYPSSFESLPAVCRAVESDART